MRNQAGAVIAFALASVGTSSASAQTFYYIAGVSISGLSDDGHLAVGNFDDGSGCTWTAAGGIKEVNNQSGLTTYAVSGNGAFIAGGHFSGQAFRMSTSSGGPQQIGAVAGYAHTQILGSNFDGSVLAGRAISSNGQLGNAVYWSQSAGLVDLGHLHQGDEYTQISAVSRDGSTLVGYSVDAAGGSAAFTWSQTSGYQQLPERGGLDGSSAFGVNSNGTIVVGSDGFGRAVAWYNGVATHLAQVQGPGELSQASALSASALLLGGWSDNGNTFGHLASVWTPSGGMLLVNYLKQFGITIAGNIRLQEVTAISADGATIAGKCFDTKTGFNSGFVVTIPSPATIAIAIAGMAVVRRRR